MKLSIIVPVYNVAPYLRACLDSLVAASEKVKSEKGVSAEVEVICVDDGSTDGSAEILDEFQSELEKKVELDSGRLLLRAVGQSADLLGGGGVPGVFLHAA